MGTCHSVKSDISCTNLATLQSGMLRLAGTARSKKDFVPHYFALHYIKDHQVSCHSSLIICNIILLVSNLQIYLKLNKCSILDSFTTN